MAAFGLPARSAAMELDLDAVLAAGTSVRLDGSLSGYPVAKEDVALVVGTTVAAADVEAALRDGAGELLESVRLFDVYTGEQVAAGEQVPRVRAALPRPGPHAHRRRGERRA